MSSSIIPGLFVCGDNQTFHPAPFQGGWTALMWACYKGRTDVVELLLSHGANPNVTGLVSVRPSPPAGSVAGSRGRMAAEGTVGFRATQMTRILKIRMKRGTQHRSTHSQLSLLLSSYQQKVTPKLPCQLQPSACRKESETLSPLAGVLWACISI